MPDKDHKLTQEEKNRVIAWLDQHVPKGVTCSICGNTKWTLSEHLIAGTINTGGNVIIGGITYPQFMLICTKCAHTVYFNAVLSGVLKVEKPKEESEKGNAATDPSQEKKEAADA